MSAKPFTPKLDGARPRVSQALQSAALEQFTPDQIEKLAKLPKVKGTKSGAASKALLELTGKF